MMLRGIMMDDNKVRSCFHTIRRYGYITGACLIYGVGISLFIDPNDLAPGGFTGLAVILNRVIPVETGTIYLLLNIPVIFLGIRKFGWKFTVSTLYAIFVVSLTTNSLSQFPAVTKQPFLGAFFGGILIAAGMGIVFRNSATTGGVDIIIKCLRLRFPHLKTSTLMLIVDAFIFSFGGIIFGNIESVLYSIISALATSYVLELVLYGHDEAKLIYIISDKSNQITARLLAEIVVGVTILHGSGAYMNKEKKVLMCVVKKQMAHKVEEIVKQEDGSAFMIITKASEIYGEGYKSYFGEVL